MKSIMKNIVWAFALLTVACYDDKGSYDYHDINEVAITLENMSVRLPKSGTTEVQLVPELTQTLVQNEDNLTFYWEQQPVADSWGDWKACGEEKVCKFIVTPESKDTRFRLTLHDKTVGTTWYKEVVLKMIEPYSHSWFVLQDEGGKAVLGVADGKGKDAVVIRDVIREDTGEELALTGVPRALESNVQYESEMKMLSAFLGTNAKSYRALMILTDQDMRVMDASSFTPIWTLDKMLMMGGIPYAPEYMRSRTGNGGETLINDGKLYYAIMDGYSIYRSMKTSDGTDYTTHVTGIMGTRHIVYDEQGHRFLTFNDAYDLYYEVYTNKPIRLAGASFVDNNNVSMSLIGENTESENVYNKFDPDRIDPNLKMVSMSEQGLVGREYGLLAFAYDEAARKVHVFEFASKGWTSGQTEYGRCHGKYEFDVPEGVNPSDLRFVTTRLFNRMFFMAAGNKIYKVDLNRGTPRLSPIYTHENASVKITNIKFKFYSMFYNFEGYRMLGAVLDYGSGGGIVEMELNDAGDVKRDVEPVEHKGFGKIVDFCYVFKETAN